MFEGGLEADVWQQKGEGEIEFSWPLKVEQWGVYIGNITYSLENKMKG